LFAHSGGLLHGDLPLSDADRAVDPRSHPAWGRDRHPVLSLPRPGETGRPTGTATFHKQENLLIASHTAWRGVSEEISTKRPLI